MEEMMMETTGQERLTNPTSPNIPPATWKVYDNPFYYYSHRHRHHHLHRIHHHFIFISLQSQLDLARTQIKKLKAEIEFERRMRKKAESSKKRLEREVLHERKRRRATECVVEELAKEVVEGKAEMGRVRKEMKEERKMWRDQRVKMKIEEAKVLMKEKMLELSYRKSNSQRGCRCGGQGVKGTVPTKSKKGQKIHVRGLSSGGSSPMLERELGSKVECPMARIQSFLSQKAELGSVRPDILHILGIRIPGRHKP